MFTYAKRIMVRLRNFRKNAPDLKQIQSKLALKEKYIASKANKVDLPPMEYPELNNYFMGFANSRQINGRVNGLHLILIIGAKKVGKTSFVEKNLVKFKQSKQQKGQKYAKKTVLQFNVNKSPQYLEKQIQQTQFENQHCLALNFNLQNQPYSSFEGMLFKFHRYLIKQIVQLSETIKPKIILTANIIRHIVLHQNAPQHVYLFIRDVIHAIINDADAIYIPNKNQIIAFNDTLKNQGYEYFFSQKYSELIQIIANSMRLTQLQASISLFYSVAARIQYEQRPQTHLDRWWQSGIETTDFLFDILNHLCGFGLFNRQIVDNFKQGNKIDQSILTSYIMQGNHIDVVLSLLNIEKVNCYGTQQFWDWFDHILCRLTNSSNLRTHFPMIIELGSRKLLGDIQKMMNCSLENPLIMQIPGYFRYTINASNLTSIFQMKFIHHLLPKLGRNPHTWDQCIQELALNNPLHEIQACNTPNLRKCTIDFQANFNLLFCDQDNLALLNEGTLNYHLLMILRLLKKRKGILHTYRNYYYTHWFNKPPFISFIKSNMLFDHYYMCSMELSHMLHLKSVKDLQIQLSKKYKWRYKFWKTFQSPYWIYPRQLVYSDKIDDHIFQLGYAMKQKTDYHILMTYFGPDEDYLICYNAHGKQASV